uniref:Putative secreted protein n=1 Tax=Ixodes ricinus TaxID=34613 RepID=A0A6B0U0S5_IXORI
MAAMWRKVLVLLSGSSRSTTWRVGRCLSVQRAPCWRGRGRSKWSAWWAASTVAASRAATTRMLWCWLPYATWQAPATRKRNWTF